MRRAKPKNLKGHIKQDYVRRNICSICGNIYIGFGNNSYPINDGRCCDDCNSLDVIPARLTAMYERDKAKEGK